MSFNSKEVEKLLKKAFLEAAAKMPNGMRGVFSGAMIDLDRVFPRRG